MQAKHKSAPKHHDDGQWSHGLISAAKLVAQATKYLCETANDLVQGNASEEKLVSAAKQVSASTQQLVYACQAKTDQYSESMVRLQAAGKAVRKASDCLVDAASAVEPAPEVVSASEASRNESNFERNRREVMAREAILKKEKELEEARRALVGLRNDRYHPK